MQNYPDMRVDDLCGKPDGNHYRGGIMDSLTLILAVVAVVGALLVGYAAGKFSGRLTRLEAQIDGLQKARLSHKQAAGLEDAMAIVMDLERQIQEEELETNYKKMRSEQVLKILRVLRSDPGRYDVDAPNGKK